MLKIISLSSLCFIAAAAALTPYVHGGLSDLGQGSWIEYTGGDLNFQIPDFGATFYLGGGFSWQLKQFRTETVLPTLSLDTDFGFARAHGEWPFQEPEGWQETFYPLMATEIFVFRLRVPVLSRLLTPFLGVGGGVAIIPSYLSRIEGFPNSGIPGHYEDNIVAVKPVYAVPFGLEITLTPQHTIYGRFGAMAPAGEVEFNYLNNNNRYVRVSSEVPNSFVVLFGYRHGI